MARPVISIEGVSKSYRLGMIGGATLKDDFTRWMALLHGKTDPLAPIGAEAHQVRIVGETFWALRDVSFEVREGEVVGLIGRNGAGKSTLLKILSQVTAPTSGEIKINGRVASLLEVGTGFHPDLTGRDNVFLNGAILGMSKREIRSKFDQIVDFSGIEEFIDTPVKRYSSGMYVRLAFAVAAHLDPEILIVDEVLAVGDAEFQKKCLGKMENVARGGRTVLFVSHNMSAIRSLCRTAILLDGGKVEEKGSAATVLDNYLSSLHEESALAIDLSKVPRSASFGSRLRITHVEINGGRGIWHNEPLEVEFAFECFAETEAVSIGIGFSSRDGTRILSIDSDIPGPRWRLRSGEKGTARLAVSKLDLEPDHYRIEVGARSGDNFGLDYLANCGEVTVLPGEGTPAVIAMRESGRGGVREPAAWSLDVQRLREVSAELPAYV